MEFVSGITLWLAEILGVQAIRKENNLYRKIFKIFIFMLAGFVAVVLFFWVFGQPK